MSLELDYTSMRTEDTTNVDIEADLKCAAGIHMKVACKVRLPGSGWDGAHVEIALPYTPEVLKIEAPYQVIGTDSLGRTIHLDGVFSDGLSYRFGRVAGVVPLRISHIDRLRIGGKTQKAGSPRNLILVLARNEYLLSLFAEQSAVTNIGQTEQVLTLNLPHLGPVVFSRVWEFVRSIDRLHATAKCAFHITVQSDAVLPSISTLESELRTALVIPSLLWRQRLSVLGWAETERDGSRVETWNQPLTPISTESMGVPPGDTLIHESELPTLLPLAIEKFSSLPSDKQRLIEEMAMGLVPYVKQGHSQRFLSMFHALEACRKFAGKEPTAEVKADTEKLVAVLKKAAIDNNGMVGDRLSGMAAKVSGGPQVDLKIQLQEVFQNWGVYTTDLWPISGSDKLPGLKQLRDKLSHKGATALNGGCLVIATEHLSVLLERIVVTLLELPLTETVIAPQRLRYNHWFDPRVVMQEREQIFTDPDWA